jgi:hypothetical protein
VRAKAHERLGEIDHLLAVLGNADDRPIELAELDSLELPATTKEQHVLSSMTSCTLVARHVLRCLEMSELKLRTPSAMYFEDPLVPRREDVFRSGYHSPDHEHCVAELESPDPEVAEDDEDRMDA